MNKDILINTLDEKINDRIKKGANFYNVVSLEEVSAEEYYVQLKSELIHIFNNIFSDEDFYLEQKSTFADYDSYINNLINDCVKEDDEFVEM